MHRHQAVDEVAAAAYSHHLQHTLLCAVVAILRTSLALGNPYGLLLLTDGVVHVARHAGRGFEHLAHGESALNDEGFVDANQFLNPGIDEQIVTNGNLHRVLPLIH